MGREAVAQRVQRHALLDPGFISRLVEQATQRRGSSACRAYGQETANVPEGALWHRNLGAPSTIAATVERLRRQHMVRGYCHHLRKLATGRGCDAAVATATAERARLARAQAELAETKTSANVARSEPTARRLR